MAYTPNIRSFEPVVPMIYAYSHPDYPPHQGWTKIGYTEKQSVARRIGQQTHTADIQWTLAWMDNATRQQFLAAIESFKNDRIIIMINHQ